LAQSSAEVIEIGGEIMHYLQAGVPKDIHGNRVAGLRDSSTLMVLSTAIF
jgi:hypothetical protein